MEFVYRSDWLFDQVRAVRPTSNVIFLRPAFFDSRELTT